MRLLRRILLTVCTTLTIVLVLVWIRSVRVCDVVTYDGTNGHHYEALLLANQIRLSVVDGWPVRQPSHWFQTSLHGYPVYGQNVLRVNYWHFGFAVESGGKSFYPVGPEFPPPHLSMVRTTYRLYAVPIAFPIILFSAYPTWEVFIARRRRLRRESRRLRGQCLYCGYDLRASPARCPECGRAAAVPRPCPNQLPRCPRRQSD